MEENELNLNEIVKIEQMPKVFSQLETIGKFIDNQVKDIDIIECNEENKQEIKKRRTELNNILKTLDDRRKFIKNKILEPYEMFNEKYENECKNKLLNASEILKNKIDDIENVQKQQKEDELREFVKQHCEANNVHIEFDRIGLNITLSASMKSLKEQAKAFIEKVASDLKLIELEEYSSEILYEYNKTFDFAQSKIKVVEYHKQLEEIQKQQEIKQEQEKQEEQVIEKVDEIVAPVEVIEDDELITVSFKVTGTKEQIKKIKELIIEMGVEYE